MGRFPLKIDIDKKILNYILHLKAQPEDSIVNQAFKISKQLHSKDRNSFYNNVMNLLNFQNMTIDDILTKTDVNSYVTKAKESYIEHWKTKLENSNKLEFYKTFKSDFTCEQYLNTIKNPVLRRNYTKFRISNHNLMIEHGRYGKPKIPRENRLCLICNSGHVENENHLIFECSYYNELRERLFEDIKNIAEIDLTQDLETQFLNMILKSKNPSVIQTFSKFISDCFHLRENSLSSG